MSESSIRPFSDRVSALHVWLRFVLAAFVLALYTSLALASGVAHADEGPSGNESGSGTKTSQQSDTPASETDREADESASDDAATDDDTDRDVTDDTSTTTATTATEPADPESALADADPQAKIPADVDTVTPTTPETSQPETAAPTVADDVAAAIDEDAPGTAPPTLVPADDSGNARQSDQLAAAATAGAELSAATPGPSLRIVEASAAPDTTATALAAVEPGPPFVPATQRDLGPPLAGLVADVATVAVSAVHSLATSIAQAFGPDSFLGVPYLLATTVANAAAAVGRTIVGAPLFEPPGGRFTVTYGILDGLAFFNPTKPPAGANDPSITVTPERPLPIILLNGTVATQGVSWSVGSPVLANAGYKVYSFNYGNVTPDPNAPIQSFADIRRSGMELAAEVDRVLAETGAPKVILIGHSQGGGILPVHYINNLGGAAKVSQLIGIAPSNHGTDFNGLIALQSLPIFGPLALALADAIGPALQQQTLGSSFQDEVYGNGDTRPGVLYTTIVSLNDEVVTPVTQQFLAGPYVTNIVLQDRYPGQIIGHANIMTSPQAFALVLEALASNPAANPLQNQTLVAA